MPARIIFITGTDTGVGKTLLTGMLLAHLRHRGVGAMGLKPFCSGSRRDVQLLHTLQEGMVPASEINPFHFREPLAPFSAARLERQSIPLAAALDHIQTARQRCDCLLIEGIGGVMVPLGRWAGRGVPTTPPGVKIKTPRSGQMALFAAYTLLDLIANLDCETIVVARNQLGTLNHTLLTVAALRRATGTPPNENSALRTPHSALKSVVLMDCSHPDLSSSSNPRVLANLLAPTPLVSVPFLGRNCRTASGVKANARKFEKILARLLA